MTDEAANKLKQAVREMRENQNLGEPRGSKPVNPYGKIIYNLNMEWAEERARMEELLKDKREAYESKIRRNTQAMEKWKQENAEALKTDHRGRRRRVYPDAVKIAAAEALRSGEGKTTIRVMLGITDTEKLNTLLAEGEALLPPEVENNDEGSEW